MTVQKDKISRSAWMTLVILSCLGLIAMYTETMILPAIPDFIKDFGITYNTSSWILSSYLISGAVMTPTPDGEMLEFVSENQNDWQYTVFTIITNDCAINLKKLVQNLESALEKEINTLTQKTGSPITMA